MLSFRMLLFRTSRQCYLMRALSTIYLYKILRIFSLSFFVFSGRLILGIFWQFLQNKAYIVSISNDNDIQVLDLIHMQISYFLSLSQKKKIYIYIYFISTMSLAFGILEELQDNLVEFSHFMSS